MDVGVNDGSCGVVWYQLVYILLNFTIRYRFEGFIDGFIEHLSRPLLLRASFGADGVLATERERKRAEGRG